MLNDLIPDPIKRDASEIQLENTYTNATFMLDRSRNGRFLVGANVWKVPQVRGGTNSHETSLYAYQLPHDHNFDFLTVGYYGPGYETDIYEFDYSRLTLEIGELAHTIFKERCRQGHVLS